MPEGQTKKTALAPPKTPWNTALFGGLAGFFMLFHGIDSEII